VFSCVQKENPRYDFEYEAINISKGEPV